MNRKPLYQQLYFWVLIGMLLGVFIGYFCPSANPLHLRLFGTDLSVDGSNLKPISDAFIRLIRMMVAPIIFTTVVTGIARIGNLKRLGRIGLKSLLYFEIMTTIALIIGWCVAAIFRPGAGMNVDVASLSTTALNQKLGQAPASHSMIDFLLNIIPETIIGAFAKGDLLQVLFVSVLFGI